MYLFVTFGLFSVFFSLMKQLEFFDFSVDNWHIANEAQPKTSLAQVTMVELSLEKVWVGLFKKLMFL
jgi:hypothetical protein